LELSTRRCRLSYEQREWFSFRKLRMMIVDVINCEIDADDVKQVSWTDDYVELELARVLTRTQLIAVHH